MRLKVERPLVIGKSYSSFYLPRFMPGSMGVASVIVGFQTVFKVFGESGVETVGIFFRLQNVNVIKFHDNLLNCTELVFKRSLACRVVVRNGCCEFYS